MVLVGLFVLFVGFVGLVLRAEKYITHGNYSWRLRMPKNCSIRRTRLLKYEYFIVYMGENNFMTCL